MANGKKIPKKEAIEMVKKFKANNPNSTKSVLYDASFIQQLLNIPGCVSVRIHLAEDSKKTTTFVLVAVDKDGNAILPTTDESTTEAAFILDEGLPCPPVCPGGEL